jgi:hypothetical protein
MFQYLIKIFNEKAILKETGLGYPTMKKKLPFKNFRNPGYSMSSKGLQHATCVALIIILFILLLVGHVACCRPLDDVH